MKSVISGINEKPERGFPKLMVNNVGTVVLFTSSQSGTVIYPSEIGEMVNDWIPSYFVDFDGKLTLSND